MPKDPSFADLKARADYLGYRFRLNPNPRFVGDEAQWRPPDDSSKRDPSFEKQLNAAKKNGTLKLGLSTPEAVKALNASAKEPFTVRLARKLDEWRDEAAPYVGAGLQALGGQPPDVAGAKAQGNQVLKFVMPPGDLLTKALGVASVAQPESRLIRYGVPIAAGAVTGGLEGYEKGDTVSGALKGAAKGTAIPLVGELGNLPSWLGQAGEHYQLVKQAQKLAAEYDDKVPGEELAKRLRLPAFSNMIAKGRNWVLALRDGTVAKEAGQRFEDNLSNIVAKADQEAGRIYQTEVDAFKQKWGLQAPVPKNFQMPQQAYDEAKALQARKAELQGLAGRAERLFKFITTKSKSVYDASGALKPGEKAWETRQLIESAKGRLGNILKPLGLSDAYDQAREEYSLFSQLKDFAEDPKALINGKHANLDYFAKNMAGQGKMTMQEVQNRFKGSYQDMLDLFRRHAAESKGFDAPGLLNKIRLYSYGTNLHVGGPIAEFLSGEPLLETPITDLPDATPAVKRSGRAATRFLTQETANWLSGNNNAQPQAAPVPAAAPTP